MSNKVLSAGNSSMKQTKISVLMGLMFRQERKDNNKLVKYMLYDNKCYGEKVDGECWVGCWYNFKRAARIGLF